MNYNSYDGLIEIGEISTTRRVYKIVNNKIPNKLKNIDDKNNVVIKVAQSEKCYDTNRLEFNVWRKTKNDNLFCPISKLLNKGEIIVMNKAKTDNITDHHVEKVFNDYRSQYELNIRTDIKKKNIGLIGSNNKPVLIDYPFVPV